MKASDLGELYSLLSMYQRTYGNVEDILIKEIEGRYEEAERLFCTSRDDRRPAAITNPRTAGRKPRCIPGEAEKILAFRQRGMTIRQIAAEMGCSTGYVHKLIYKHSKK